jgi:hypothetical protein
MNEDLLHYLWKHRLFNASVLSTVSGEEVIVLKAGEHNHDAGPDFFNARIRINGTEWAGNVELHLRSSDWTKHKHHEDARYNSVILHAVYEHNLKETQPFPVVELRSYIREDVIDRYRQLLLPRHRIPCAQHIREVNTITIRQWLDRLLTERLEKKCQPIKQLLTHTRNNYEEAFYIWFFRALGLQVNADAMEALARILPYKILLKHSNNLKQTEALLLGCAGLLPKVSNDIYLQSLQDEFAFLQHKYTLHSLEPQQWRWLRLRPSNFPELRLAQLAALLHHTPQLLNLMLNAAKAADALRVLHVQASPYWNTHYRIGVPSSPGRIKKLGNTAAEVLLINAVIPFLFLYGEERHLPEMKEKAIQWLEQLPPEENRILKEWKKLGISAEHAGDSQSLLTLQKEYCNFTRCLDCRIGQHILNTHA